MRSSSSNNMPWLSVVSTNANQIDKKKDLSGLKYPLFSNLADDTDDPYWKNFLYSCAKGKLPKGFVFNGKILMYKNGSLQLELVNNPQATKQLINFIRHNTKMRSKMDLEREKDMQAAGKSTSITKWSDIRAKATKRLLIIDYIYNLTIKYQLSELEKNEVTTLINYYLLGPGTSVITPCIKINDNSIIE